MKKNFLISTGGSGGHVLPASILYDHLSEKANLVMSIDKRGLKYLNEDLYQFEIIDTPKLNNMFFLPFKFVIILFLIFKSLILIRKKKIDKVFSTGGYMSLPLIIAARLLKLKIYLIEPNHIVGQANKYFLNFCEKIFCYDKEIKNFPDHLEKKKVIINPLISKSLYKIKTNPNKNKIFTILVVGGSQGANIFDKNLKFSIINISKKIPIKIIQQTSKENINSLEDFYTKNNIENKIFSFEKNFFNIIQQADLCITRAGASSLAELAAINVPFLAVPLPTSKDNHQFENANFYKNNDCCWVIEQKNFEEKIEDVLIDILNNRSNYLEKKENLKKLNYQNTWINVNQKILKNINEN